MRRSLALFSLLLMGLVFAQKSERIPHAQDKMPGPALTPAEALKKMKVPDGFTVELVAAEPQIVNPVAMTFDEKGRVWITESLEYPRRSAGPGKDRVKVLEIGKDGKASKVTTFAEGLNIPSGIAVGHGGVWVANAPDILFYKIGEDGKAAGKPEVVVSGFGRTDTHELPNSLTWGPDGWLYGWNGVFNHSHVKHRGKEYKFTCAIFRIHPKTRDFELWCEGTSNPWGLAINEEGHFFASACVIDHLWHLTETGYYHRQGGPYPPHTWPMGSIVKHRHQKAAYCGIHWFDSDAYPEKYRGKLFMGNIHGGCINVDSVKRDGSTYFGSSDPDFLTSNDQWFMPVVQKTGPDGFLYVLDWYDRYHCYQDANRDPKGIDRLNGRLYRIRYKEAPTVPIEDLSRRCGPALVEKLSSPNVYIRDIAQRLFAERLLGTTPWPRGSSEAEVVQLLEGMALNGRIPLKFRMHAVWALSGGGKDSSAFLTKLLDQESATLRAWGVRAAGNKGKVDAVVRERIAGLLTKEKSPDVLVQLAIADAKLGGQGTRTLLRLLAAAPKDRLLQHIVWQNLHPRLETNGEAFADALKEGGWLPQLAAILPRSVERILASHKPQPEALARLFQAARKGDESLARRVLDSLVARAATGEISPEALSGLKKELGASMRAEMADRGSLRFEAALLLAAFREEAGLASLRATLASGPYEARGRALDMLASLKDTSILGSAETLLEASHPSTFRAQAIAALGRLEDDKVAAVLLKSHGTLPEDLKPRVVETLTQRASWGKALLRAVAEKKVPASAINVNQARRLLESKDKVLVGLVAKHWGTLRSDRNPDREVVVRDMRNLLSHTKGDPRKGIAVYKSLCGQCHKIHGEGVEVGPDITLNGRASFDQLLSNVFDPSLVIGPGYHAVTVIDNRGRSITGLLAEDGDKRVVLKVQGGKLETIARGNIEKMETSKLSMMPEGVEKQFKPGEIADLFAFLCLDRHPDDRMARYIPGTPRGLAGGK